LNAPVEQLAPNRLKLAHRSTHIRLATPLRIARGTGKRAEVVEVAVTANGLTGYGEGAPIPRFGETVASARAFLDDAESLLPGDPRQLEEIDRQLLALPGPMAAKAALDAALHDLAGKLSGQPVWRMLGLERRGPATSYTISLDDPETMARSAEVVTPRFKILKLKLGGGDGRDVARVRAVRSVTDAHLYVDVNEGWTFSEATEAIPELAALGVQLVEQPLPAGDSGAAALKASSSLPIYLDEDCRTLDDVEACAARGHGVNVKLAKCGGIRAALRIVEAARSHDLGVMLGCMVESSLGIAAACQIASACDHVDLDSNLLIARDCWRGPQLIDGVQMPSDAPGLGVSRSRRRRWW
jgi:L-Ala-D/L-Glu epimerase / N-acetyl-D-glutamate racemase